MSRDTLLNRLATECYRHGTFTLASGRSSDHYVNCKPVALSGSGLALLSPAMLELVDLALDQVLMALADPSMLVYFHAVSVLESLIGFCAVLMVYFSIDRFLVFLRSISFELRHIGL